MDVYNGRPCTPRRCRCCPVFRSSSSTRRKRTARLLSSEACTAGVSYEFTKIGWAPKLTYRYASFQGDDPATAKSEGFDSLFTGFYDWGTWWQGEIAGEYFLSNSNLDSHQLRLHLTPNEHVSGGLIACDFLADQPASFRHRCDVG